MHTCQPGAGAARMVAVGPIVKRVGLVLGEAADDHEAILERRQRAENRRQLEGGAFADGGPVVDAGEVPRHAVRHVDEAEAPDRVGRGLRHRHAGGHHRVEQWKCERCPDAAEKRSSWQRSLGDKHGGYPAVLIRNGALRTTPMISEEKRWSARPASRTIARTAGPSYGSRPRPRA